MRATILTVIGFLSIAVAAKEKNVVCHFKSWAVKRQGNGNFNPTDIDPTLCTHLIYVGARLSPEGTITARSPAIDLPENGGADGYSRFNQLRNRNPALKTMINIGHNQNSSTFSEMASNSDLRKVFVSNAVNFIKKYSFNGADLDWNYPAQKGGTAADKENYVLLLKELREAFDKEGFLLSAHVAGPSTIASISYDIPYVAKYLHFINLIIGGYHKISENVTGSSAALYAGSWEEGNDLLINSKSAVLYWLSQGAPAEKLNLGIPLYGNAFTLANAEDTEIRSPASGPGEAGPYTAEAGFLSYQEVCEKLLTESWTIRFSDEQRVPFAFKDKQWISYDNVQSATEKAKFINKLELGGASLWSVDMDDDRGICGKKYPILSAVNQALRKPCVLDELEDIWKSTIHVLQNHECLNKEGGCNSTYALS